MQQVLVQVESHQNDYVNIEIILLALNIYHNATIYKEILTFSKQSAPLINCNLCNLINTISDLPNWVVSLLEQYKYPQQDN